VQPARAAGSMAQMALSPAAEAPAPTRAPGVEPGVETTPDDFLEQLQKRLPPYAVVLHNDDVNDMVHVVRSLMRSIPALTLQKATKIMLEAHNEGRACVIVCPLEQAELYRDRLQSCRLTATIEKA
jgi:ATP-dependent Clp protease adaptor protein ClpS